MPANYELPQTAPNACPTCGQPVKIEGRTTLYYVPAGEDVETLIKENAKLHMSLKNCYMMAACISRVLPPNTAAQDARHILRFVKEALPEGEFSILREGE